MPDNDLQQAVLDELAADQKLDHTAIAVTAEVGGRVTLEGTVGSPRLKLEAGRDARRVHGVRQVNNQLQVRILVGDQRDDAELRGAVLQALRLNSLVPPTVDAKADNGVVTLTGHVLWHYQRDEAEFVASNVRGVRAVSSTITLQPNPSETDVAKLVSDALQRDALIDADNVIVEAEGGTVILSGSVSSWAAHDVAIDAAWMAPGVNKVTDNLDVRY